jgi:hypothetical protein
MELGPILEKLKAERDLLSRAIDALRKIASNEGEPQTLRRKLITVATDRIEKRRQGVIPQARDLARYDEMLKMMASGSSIKAIADHYGLSKQRVHQLLRVKQLDPAVRRPFRNPKGLPGKSPRCTCGLYSALYAVKIGHLCK